MITVLDIVLELRKCQDGKCKSRRTINEGEFWELTDEITLEMKSEEPILTLVVRKVADSY